MRRARHPRPVQSGLTFGAAVLLLAPAMAVLAFLGSVDAILLKPRFRLRLPLALASVDRPVRQGHHRGRRPPRADWKPLFGNNIIAECYDVLKKAILAG